MYDCAVNHHWNAICVTYSRFSRKSPYIREGYTFCDTQNCKLHIYRLGDRSLCYIHWNRFCYYLLAQSRDCENNCVEKKQKKKTKEWNFYSIFSKSIKLELKFCLEIFGIIFIVTCDNKSKFLENSTFICCWF